MRRNLRPLLALLLLLLAGCSTTAVSLDYTRALAPVAGARPQVAVGSFADQRRDDDPRQLGAIRGGYGQPLKTLVLSEDASVVVQKAFAQALDKRGLLAPSGSGRYTLSGVIKKLDCSQYIRREAHADIVVSLTDNATGKVVLQQTAHADGVTDPSGADYSIFGKVEDLRVVAERTLQDAIDKALSDARFAQAVAG
jgi:uncharacterized lipoprotein YajG